VLRKSGEVKRAIRRSGLQDENGTARSHGQPRRQESQMAMKALGIKGLSVGRGRGCEML